MNHFAITGNHGFRVRHLSIVSQLRSLSKRSTLPDATTPQNAQKLAVRITSPLAICPGRCSRCWAASFVAGKNQAPAIAMVD
jgi:hypothetical protein